jgi:uncharacterized ion transporter superfamily protein YfcC
MEQFTLQQKLYIIVFKLTTPLVSLNGFCDVVKDRTKSQFVLEQLETIKGAIEHVKSEKDILREKSRQKMIVILFLKSQPLIIYENSH